MNEEEIEEIRKRAEAATPGPWTKWHCKDLHKDRHGPSCRGVLSARHGNVTMPTEADDDFVAHSRQDIPNLLIALEAAQKENKRLMEELLEAREEIYQLKRSDLEALRLSNESITKHQEKRFEELERESNRLREVLEHISRLANRAIGQRDEDVIPRFFRTVMEGIAYDAGEALAGMEKEDAEKD